MNGYDFQAGIARHMEKETRARRILGVSGEDGPERIRKAFRLLAMRYHPDKAPGDGYSLRRFQDVVNAYGYLAKGAGDLPADGEMEQKHPRPPRGSRRENAWGYYLWWRDAYFEEGRGARTEDAHAGDDAGPFDRRDPARYERWYATGTGRGIDTEEKTSLARLLGPGGGRRLLEVGCGTGHFTGWFRTQGYKAFGIDISHRFIDYARRQAGGYYLLADGSALPFPDGAFSAAAAVAALEFARSPEAIVREMDRVSETTLLLLMLNPDFTRASAERRRRRGILGSARCWDPDAAVRLLRDAVPGAAHGRIHRETHARFYLVRLTKGGAPSPRTNDGPKKPAEAR